MSDNRSEFLSDKTNENTKIKTKLLSSSNSNADLNSKEHSERRIITDFIKDYAYKTQSMKLKYDLKEIIKILRGQEIDEVVELKKVIEELLMENEELIEKKI